VAGSLKKIFIIGNLGSDPVMRYTQDGTPVASFNVAVNERSRRAQGADAGQSGQPSQPEETTTWFRVSAWRRQAEIANDLLKKGTSVYVSGNLTVREFTGNDGQKRTSLDVQMDDMQILTPKGVQEGGGFDEAPAFGSGQAASRPSTSYGNKPQGGRQAPEIDAEDDSEIPF
jgi:single-strand DNA-binding protein